VFGRPDNAAVILGSDGSSLDVPEGSKTRLAHVICDEIVARLS
jgi:phosphopantothenoylcysteine decarboxylase/phosphopantothenate--cysteine ligase